MEFIVDGVDAAYAATGEAAGTVVSRLEQNRWTAIPLIGFDLARLAGNNAVSATRFGGRLAIGLVGSVAEKTGLMHRELDPNKPDDFLEIQELVLEEAAQEEGEDGKKLAHVLLEDPSWTPGYFKTWRSGARRKDVHKRRTPKTDALLFGDFRRMVIERVGNDIRSIRALDRALSLIREHGLVDLAPTDFDPNPDRTSPITLGSVTHSKVVTIEKPPADTPPETT